MKWLNRERVNNYPWVFIILYVVIGGYWIVSAILWGQGLDIQGTPVGADFAAYWAVSALCLQGTPAAVYNPTKLNAAIRKLTGTDTYKQCWNYSPSALLIMLPLALLPYYVSLLLWLSITLGGALLVLRRVSPHPATMKLALAFPGTFQNFMQGQNGFLSAGFLGGGLLLLNRLPFVGGLLLGLMSYKPHLAVLIPIALIGGKKWKALSGAAVATVSMIILSALVFGLGIWITFWKYLFVVPPILLNSSEFWPKMATTFTSVRLLGGSYGIAWILQGMVIVAAAGAVFWIWWRKAPYPICASALVFGTLLATPYAFDYDLFILSLPIAWMGWEGNKYGWRSEEKLILSVAWLSPFIVPVLAMATGFQVGPIILGAFLILLMFRIHRFFCQSSESTIDVVEGINPEQVFGDS